MAILVVFAHEDGTITSLPPEDSPIYLWNIDQSITFTPGDGNTEITGLEFGNGWPGGPAVQIGSGAWTASAGKPLGHGTGESETYSVTIKAIYTPTTQFCRHDPDIENHPQP